MNKFDSIILLTFLCFGFFTFSGCLSGKKQSTAITQPEPLPYDEIDSLIIRLNGAYPDTELSREEAAAILQSALVGHVTYGKRSRGAKISSDFDDEWIFPKGLEQSHNSVLKDSALGIKEVSRNSSRGLTPEKRKDKKKLQYYSVESNHIRMQPIQNDHIGKVQMARITLPEHYTKDTVFKTALGKIKSADHLVFSHEDIRQYKFPPVYTADRPEGFIPKVPDFERIELVSPARYAGVRFAPLAIFLGYEKADDTTPSFYIFESGDGLGVAHVLYLSPDMSEIIQDSGYRPSSFASPDNIYNSSLKMDVNHPSFVSIKISEDIGSPVYFEIQMELTPASFEEVTGLGNFIMPVKSLIKAAGRILKLGRKYKLPKIPNRTLAERILILEELIQEGKTRKQDVRRLESRRKWLMDKLEN